MGNEKEIEELKEFMELSSRHDAKDDDDDNSGRGRTNEENKMKQMGRACQYAINGPGFTPTSKTIQALRPDIYKVTVINQALTFLPQRVITDKLLRLPDSRSDDVIKEIERFWTLRDKFEQHGFSHKRGFLLWGPPGSGKTCTVSIVSNDLVQAGGVVILGNEVNPAALSSMLTMFRQIETKRRVVVILEDIDTIVHRFGESEVLSLLDGEDSIDGVVFIATTNYPEKLDGRIVNRPSRFDRIVKIGTPNFEARLMYLKSRNLELPDLELEEWADATEGFSIAHLKELIIGIVCLGGTMKDEVHRLKSMARTPKSDSTDRTLGFGAAQ